MKLKKKSTKIFMVILCILFFSFGIYKYLSIPKIDRILETESYSYLSSEAKEYLKGVYKETGEVLLTEKNKKSNKPYLNPRYVEYLEVSDKEKKEIAYIPSPTVLDFQGNVDSINDVKANSSTYDLRNINGKNYVTPVRNQGRLGLCWAFSAASTAETFLLKQAGNSYSNDTQLISERQIDYATSNDGINEYKNEYVSFLERNLGDGGNFYISTVAMANGISLVDYDWKEYNDTDLEPMELSEVLNYDNSLYEVNGTINMPIFDEKSVTDSELEEAREAYVNLIKSAIEVYGAASVATYYSSSCIHRESSLDNVVLDVSSDCFSTSDGHAMTVIGWDDNVEFDYCIDDKSHSDDVEGCTNVVRGKGAWILKNSWGEAADPYPYLAYQSDYSQFHFITDISKSQNKSWDNNYVFGNDLNTNYVEHSLKDLGLRNEEKLNTLKFITTVTYGEFQVQILQADGSYSDIFELSSDLPGLVTLDFSDYDIKINEDSQILISGTSFLDNISIFTTNIDEEYYIDLTKYNDAVIDSYEYRVYSNTKNIPSNTEINYRLFDKNGVDVSSSISVSNNIVAENNVNSLIIFDSELEAGDYVLKSSYSTYSNSVDIKIPLRYSLDGEGTTDSPYLVYNEDDLNQMRYDLDAYYQLQNDIILTEDWYPVGSYYEPFTGGLDGQGYSISNLKIKGTSSDSVGFFGYYLAKYAYDYQKSNLEYVYYREPSYIKNIIFKDADVSNYGNAGILIGELLFDSNNPPDYASNVADSTMTIDSVQIIDGKVESLDGNAGAIAAYVNIVPRAYYKHYFNINNLFSSAEISGYYSSGLIGFINDSYGSGSGIMLRLGMTNFQNAGIITPLVSNYSDTLYHSPVIGGVYGNIGITLENYIINSIFQNADYYGNFIYYHDLFFLGYYDSNVSPYLSYSYDNGYFVSDYYYPYYGSNDKYVSALDIKDSSLYSKWTDFSTYWKMETIDSISRIPVLKDVDFDYTVIDDIEINRYDEKSLFDFISGRNFYQYIKREELENNYIIELIDKLVNSTEYYDGVSIKGLTDGVAKVKLVSQYDGFEKEVLINVVSEKVDNPTITYYIDNDDSSDIYTQQVSANKTFTLIKNTFIKKGYTFNNWSTIPGRYGTIYEDESVIADGINADLRLYANWTKNKYTIKYNANGGTGTMSERTNLTTGFTLSKNLFTKVGYVFNGWNTEADGSGTSFKNQASISFDELVSFDSLVINLYAQWKPVTYDIEFNANGGTGTMNKQTISYDSETPLNTNKFIKTGYKFKEWNTKSDGSGTSYGDGASIKNLSTGDTITLYAIWVPVTYTVTYNANGGTGTMSNQVFTYDTAGTLNANQFSREGYIFKGWNTKKDGSGISYVDKASVKNITTNTSITLYAIWETELSFVINNYEVIEDNNYIDLVAANTSLEKYLKNIVVGSNYTVKVELGNKNYIYTGSITKIYYNNDLVAQYTNIVRGDVTLDGIVNIADVIKIADHTIRQNKLSKDYEKVASDVTEDNIINIADVIKIADYTLDNSIKLWR